MLWPGKIWMNNDNNNNNNKIRIRCEQQIGLPSDWPQKSLKFRYPRYN